MKIKKSKKLVFYIAGSLAAAAVIVFSVAFLISYDEITNVFVSGDVKIVLNEDKYPGNDSPVVKNIVPYQEIDKNPVVTNTGSNNAYVFLRLTVPVSSITELDEYGRKLTDAPTTNELFYLKGENDSIGLLANNFGSGWVEIKSLAQGGSYDDSGIWTYDKGASTRTYVFAYQPSETIQFLEAGQSTTPLFGKVQLKNIKEEFGVNDLIKVIKLEAFAVQSDYLDDKEEEIQHKFDEEEIPQNKRQEQRLVEIFNMTM